MNLTTVQLKGVAAALAAHSDGEVGGVKVHFRMDESGLFQMETVSKSIKCILSNIPTTAHV